MHKLNIVARNNEDNVFMLDNKIESMIRTCLSYFMECVCKLKETC